MAVHYERKCAFWPHYKTVERGLRFAFGLLIGLLADLGTPLILRAEGQQPSEVSTPVPTSSLGVSQTTKSADGESRAETTPPTLLEGSSEEVPRTIVTVEELHKSWIFFTAEMAEREATWTIAKGATEADNELICAGKPFGYLRSQEEFEDFEFGLEWKYPQDPNGNSGILIHTVEEDKIWPKSLQVQLHAPAAGSIFPTGGARSDNTGTAMGLSKPVNEWNTCVVLSRKGRVTAVINGNKVGEVTGSQPRRGRICLQSEGAEIRFRRFWVRKFPTPRPPATPSQDERP